MTTEFQERIRLTERATAYGGFQPTMLQRRGERGFHPPYGSLALIAKEPGIVQRVLGKMAR